MSLLNSRSHVPRRTPPRAVFPRAAGIIETPSPWIDMGDWEAGIGAASSGGNAGYNSALGVDGSELVIISVGLWFDATPGYQNQATRWDPISNTYSAEFRNVGMQRDQYGYGQVGSVLYLVGGGLGGGFSTSVSKFDMSTNTWTNGLTAYPLTIASPICCGEGGLLYAFGGGTPGPVQRTEAYSFNGATWTAIAPLPAAIGGGWATSIGDGTILIVGVNGIFPDYTDGYIYDPGSNTYTQIALPPYPFTLAGCMLGGDAYGFGSIGTQYLGFTEVYDVSADSWSTFLPLPAFRLDGHAESPLSAAAISDVAYVLFRRRDDNSHLMRLAL